MSKVEEFQELSKKWQHISCHLCQIKDDSLWDQAKAEQDYVQEQLHKVFSNSTEDEQRSIEEVARWQRMHHGKSLDEAAGTVFDCCNKYGKVNRDVAQSG